MKKGLIALAVIAAVGLGGVAFAHYQGSGGSGGHMMCPGYGGYGGHMMDPGSGGHMMGPGHRGYGGHMMGPGYEGYGGHGGQMMGPEYGGPCQKNAPGTDEGKILTEKDAKSIARNYIGRNPNLKVGKIEDKENTFEAEILTKDDSLVVRLTIDKTTGWVRPIY